MTLSGLSACTHLPVLLHCDMLPQVARDTCRYRQMLQKDIAENVDNMLGMDLGDRPHLHLQLWCMLSPHAHAIASDLSFLQGPWQVR